MDEVPSGMLRLERKEDPHFSPNEWLYRRVPHEFWDEPRISLDAIGLPDMSVGRGNYGWPVWLRVNDEHPEDDRFEDWGVVGFQVGDIPTPLQHEGVFLWTFAATHVPQKRNYPHTEVRCFEDSKHVQALAALPPALHLRWRKQLLWKIRIFLNPHEEAPMPMDPPSGTS